MNVAEISADAGSSLTIRLRPMTGADELSITSSDPSSVMRKLACLATDLDGEPINLDDLTISQTDRLLAVIYNLLYGDCAECQVNCRSCGERFEFSLSLSDLIAAQDAERPGPAEPDGAWKIPDGRRVRAPRISDLEAATDPASLLFRLVVSGDPAANPSAVTDFLEKAAPVLSLDLDAGCPECGIDETVRFDLARYLTKRLIAERPFLIRETHLIASLYGWSYSDIMSLARADRRAYAGLIEAERSKIRRGRRTG